jgi:hypothetical protein
MADQEYKLKYVIQGDASGMRNANRELERTDKAITKLGSGKGISGLLSGLSGVATGDQLNGFTSQITSASSALGSIPGPAGLAVGAIALLGTVTVGAIAGLYGLAKSASEYGSEIFDASEKTGLGAETLSSFKLAADQSSSSLEQVTAGVTKFSKSVGSALLDPTSEAAAAMTRLGVDPQKAVKDLDGALAGVFKRINDLPPGVTQSKAAIDAFGKAGADLLPFIRSFNGDLPALIAKCKELGITLTDKDARAADEFGDQMDTLTAQLKMAGVTFGQELMPVFLEGSRSISTWLSENKGEIASWGSFTANILRGSASVWGELTTSVKGYYDAVGQGARGAAYKEAMEWLVFGQFKAIAGGVKLLEQAGAKPQSIADLRMGDDTWHPAPKPTSEGPDYLEAIEAQKNAAEKAQKEREEIAKRDAAAQVGLLKNQLDDWVDVYSKAMQKARDILEKGGTVEGFNQMLAEATATYNSEVSEIFATLEEAERQVSDLGKKTTKELELQRVEQEKRAVDTNDKVQKDWTDAIKFRDDFSKKASADEIKRAKTDSDQLIAFNEAVTDAAIAQIEYQVAVQNQTVLGGLAQRQRLENDALQIRLAQLDIELGKVLGNAEEEKRVRNEIAILQKNIKAKGFADEIETANAVLAEGNSILAEINRRIEKGAKDAKELADNLNDAFSAMAKAQGDAQDKKLSQTVGSSTSVSAIDELHQMFVGDQNTAAIAGVEALTTAFDGLGQAVGAAVSAYVLYGSVGASVQQVTAQILASIAQQSAVKAVFELAEGFAMLALAFFGHPGAGPSATQHFIAAGVYAGIAGMAAVTGRAVAGDSFKKDSAGSSSSGSSASSGSRSRQDPAPYSRATPDAYMSGHRSEAQIVATAVDKLTRRLDSMKPGDVLVAGMRQKPGAVGKQVVQDNRGNPSIGKTLLKNAGIR